MKYSFLAIEQEPDARAAPLRTLRAKRKQENLDFRPPNIRRDRPGEDRLKSAPMLGVHIGMIPETSSTRKRIIAVGHARSGTTFGSWAPGTQNAAHAVIKARRFSSASERR